MADKKHEPKAAAAYIPVKLTDSSGGTASNTTVAALADGTTYATDVAALRNNLATIVAKINSVIDALPR